MNVLKSILLVLAIAVFCIGAIVALGYGGWAMFNWLAPKFESTRYEVHKESQMRIDGMTTEIRRHLIELESAETPTQRQLLCRNILDLADQAGRHRLPTELQLKVASLGNCGA